ncbi:MAG: hypothetical protein IJ509_03015 [Bacilli bacterium]|nr:hypothetical protein [Bacilli bacterium]
MKESTGELSMVVVTILAIALIAGVVRFLVPLAQKYVENQWSNLTSYNIEYVDGTNQNL